MLGTHLFAPAASLPGARLRKEPRHARRSRRRGRLHRRLLAYRDVEILHSPAPTGDKARCLLLVYGRRIVGRLDYELCEQCASGVVTHAQVTGPLQDSGLGTRAVSHLRAYYPDVDWYSRLTRRLARDLAHRMRLPQGFAGPCAHLRPAPRLSAAAYEQVEEVRRTDHGRHEAGAELGRSDDRPPQ
ncbi:MULTISPECIES: hypothetical protein [Streptomyces]|uniref:hypothetical protein n=1 Tax=Streptomyces TaxID=1883 RepID=UPI001E42CF42|nr:MULTISPECIES: hypothetical protein [Streptomyces]UFQ19829.1 hypothetical protein J2N69_35425 [Streptomyces huasconensis]WCL89452.1 hypothetical protein PPN52_35370 [Streptomyces sp. JCM 35825]